MVERHDVFEILRDLKLVDSTSLVFRVGATKDGTLSLSTNKYFLEVYFRYRKVKSLLESKVDAGFVNHKAKGVLAVETDCSSLTV